MRRTVLLISLLSLAFAPLPFPKPDPTKEDLQRMQGAWVLAYAHQNGVREEVAEEAVWVIKGDRLTTSFGGKPGSACSITLDGRARPGSIDLRNRRAGVAPGRYRVDGDTLTVSMGEARPADLSGRGQGNGVWVFKRRKP